MKKSLEVPVLIVCKSRDAAVELYQKLVSILRGQMKKISNVERVQSFGSHNAKFFVQHFAERDDKSDNMNWNEIVAKSTEKFPNIKMRRITVTDPFGARGFDYDVKDDEANDNGGMLVIAAHIPHKRDWIQLIGRVARGGK
jgi:hypothetical protein